jgi:glycogen operon protein
MKNFVATLMISLGTPMLLGGDEFARTQRGNNNAYCQDNEISWHDWTLQEKNSGLYRFVKEMIAFRLRHPGFMRPEFYTGREGAYNGIPDIMWFDDKGEDIDWEKTDLCLALRMDGSRADIQADRDISDFFIMFNSGTKDAAFKVCEAPEGKQWYRAVDTGFPSPEDVLVPGHEQLLPDQSEYYLRSRSMAILLSKTQREA